MVILRYSALLVLASLCLSACSGDNKSPQHEAELKKAFDKKTLDINDVPANERSMVQGFIDRNNAMKAQRAKEGK